MSDSLPFEDQFFGKVYCNMKMLEMYGFEAREAARRLDPVIKEEDGDIQLESVCIEAQRR